jgi:hypothetical protein
MTTGGGPSEHPVDLLIRDLLGTGRAATPEEVAQIIERMATAPFTMRPRSVPVNERGITHLGITLGDRISSLDYHLVKRVTLEEQWAYGTIAEEYLHDLHQAVRHREAHLALYERRDGPIAAISCPAHLVVPLQRLGPEARELALVIYSASWVRY